jgi:signal transduction histidine kinase
MELLSLVYLAAIAAAVVIALSLAVTALPLRDRPAVKPFIYHTLAVAEIAASFLMLSLSASPEQAFVWARLRFLGLAFVSPFGFLFTIEFTGRSRQIPRYLIPVLFVIPVMTQIVVWSSASSPLFFKDWGIIRTGFAVVEQSHFGVWFGLHAGWGYLLIFVYLILLLIYIRQTQSLERQKALWVLGGTIAGALLTAVTTFLHNTLPFNPTPLGLLLMSLAYSRAIRRYRILELMPTAYYTLFWNMQDATLIVNQQGELVQINPSAEKLFGKTATDLIGTNIRYLLTSLPAAPGAIQFEARIGSASVHIQRSVLDDKGNFIGSLYVLRDISERKQAEEQQARLLAELQTTNKDLRDFAHLISHDLKAPLRGISSLAGWLVADHGDRLDDEGRDLAKKISERVLSMERMINGILEYSLVGHLEESQQRVAVGDVLPEIIAAFASPGHVRIETETPLPEVRVEPIRLSQVFQNLIDNAVKYSDKPLCEIRLGCRRDSPDFWLFWVRDNGPGIDERYYDEIFQMFVTLTPKEKTENTGIGLAIVKRIVELYKGKIWLESQVGLGSTFYFTLPG